MSDDNPAGLPFSRAYLAPAKPLQDDRRFRIRLHALFELMITDSDLRRGAAKWLKYHAGIEVPGHGNPDWDSFFKKAEIAEVLDAIGLIFDYMDNQEFNFGQHWKQGVAEILVQQSMAYMLDEECAVRRPVDQEFDRTQVAAIAGLGAPRFRVSKDYFDQAIGALEKTPPDTAGMVRNTFLATESVFKLMFPVDRLVASNVRNHLLPEQGVGTQSAKTASQEMASSFARWVAACQQYRHAPGEIQNGEESPAAPPIDLAIAMMSAGATYLRWLITLDRATKV